MLPMLISTGTPIASVPPGCCSHIPRDQWKIRGNPLPPVQAYFDANDPHSQTSETASILVVLVAVMRQVSDRELKMLEMALEQSCLNCQSKWQVPTCCGRTNPTWRHDWNHISTIIRLMSSDSKASDKRTKCKERWMRANSFLHVENKKKDTFWAF